MNREMLVEKLREKGYRAEKRNVTKNGVLCEGIEVGEEKNVSVVIYTEEMFRIAEQMQIGMDELAEKVIEIYKESGCNLVDVGQLTDREYLLSHMYIGLQRQGTEDLIKRPVEQMDGVESYLYVRVWDRLGEKATLKMRPSILRLSGIEEEEAWRLAENHTCAESMIMSLSELIEGGESLAVLDDIPMYILTNQDTMYGASAILNKKLLKEFGKKHNVDKVLVLPSSIQEVLLIPYEKSLDLEYYSELVREVNRNEVDPIQQLSDQAYLMNI